MGELAQTHLPTFTDAEAELLARRREIAETGIAIADELGIQAVSMRNIARRLGVGTMTLYTWVENKDDLISVMGDALAERLLVPEPLPEDWRAALTLIATAARDTFAAHPWVLSPLRPRGALGANILRHIDQSLQTVRGLGLDPHQQSAVLQAVDQYAVGYASANARRTPVATEQVQQEPGASSPRAASAREIELRALFSSGAVPVLNEYFGSYEDAIARMMQGPPAIEDDFELGLKWLLDGIAASLTSQS